MSARARPWIPGEADPQAEGLLEKAVCSENLRRAWKQVKRNKGAAGVDGRGIEETGTFLRERWAEIREYLNPLLRGWLQYFGMGAGKKDLQSHDFWIRRRLRDLIWRQWKTPATRFKRLRELGCPKQLALIAYSRRGPWWCAGTPALTQSLTPEYFGGKGLLTLCPDKVA